MHCSLRPSIAFSGLKCRAESTQYTGHCRVQSARVVHDVVVRRLGYQNIVFLGSGITQCKLRAVVGVRGYYVLGLPRFLTTHDTPTVE